MLNMFVYLNAFLDQESGLVLLLKPSSSLISELFMEGAPGEADVDLPGADLLGELLVQPPAVHHLLPLLAHQLCSEKFLEVEVSKDQLKNIGVETGLRSEQDNAS